MNFLKKLIYMLGISSILAFAFNNTSKAMLSSQDFWQRAQEEHLIIVFSDFVSESDFESESDSESEIETDVESKDEFDLKK